MIGCFDKAFDILTNSTRQILKHCQSNDLFVCLRPNSLGIPMTMRSAVDADDVPPSWHLYVPASLGRMSLIFKLKYPACVCIVKRSPKLSLTVTPTNTT